MDGRHIAQVRGFWRESDFRLYDAETKGATDARERRQAL